MSQDSAWMIQEGSIGINSVQILPTEKEKAVTLRGHRSGTAYKAQRIVTRSVQKLGWMEQTQAHKDVKTGWDMCSKRCTYVS